MRHCLVLLALLPLLALSTLLMPRALAQGTLDQRNTAAPAGYIPTSAGGQVLAQTFTAGISGLLDSATLQLWTPAPPLTASVSISATDGGGFPSGPALASGTITVTANTSPGSFAPVTFSPAAAVTAGRVYALILTPTAAPSLGWSVTIGNTYLGGSAFLGSLGGAPYGTAPGLDFNFQTFVTAPAPASVTLTVAPTNAAPGQPVTFTAIVGCATGTPTGTVTFSSNGATLATAQVTGGSATVTLPAPAAGLFSVLATYNGDPFCLPSPSAATTPPGIAPVVIINLPVTLGIVVKGCGSIAPAALTTVNALQAIPVTAVPCPGSVFTGWTGGPCDGARINPCDIAPSGTTTMTATFTP